MKPLRRSIRRKLLLAFALNIVLMFGLGLFALIQLRSMNNTARFVEQYTIPSLDLTDNFDVVITRYRSLQLEYIINRSEADRQRIRDSMQELEQRMQNYFDGYMRLITSQPERVAFDAVQQAWKAYTEANNQRYLPSFMLDSSGTVQPSFNRLNPLYDDLQTALQALNQHTQAQANQSLSGVQNSFQAARFVVIIAIVVTIVLASVIGFVLATRIARRIQRLNHATSIVASGNLEQQVEVRSNDEIGNLAQSFNSMVSSLKEQRAILEVRNTELQASLKIQKQLNEDIMRRKQAEEAATRARIAAEATSQAKSMFLATMSHELRTPLNAILGYTQLMQQTLPDTDSLFMQPLDRIRLASRHLLTLITNILDFSKVEQGKVDVHWDEVNVLELVEEVIGILTPLAEERHNHLVLACEIPVTLLYCDQNKLRQIVYNLLSNAIKFTDSGTITVKLVADDQHWLRLAVHDTGIGISPEQQQRLFQPFIQADASISRRYGGTGLGLALSLELARLMGGTIELASTLGAGSIFTLVLPFFLEPPTQVPTQLATSVQLNV